MLDPVFRGATKLLLAKPAGTGAVLGGVLDTGGASVIIAGVDTTGAATTGTP
jgi:hypothetical protein